MASLSNRLTANKRFEFASRAFGDDKFAVVNMEGYEAISRPFRFELTLVSDDADVDFDKMLQNPATFRIYTADGSSSVPYHGMLAEFDQLHQSDGYVFYRAVLVPRSWQLSLYQVSEVYLDEKPIPALIKKVLESARFTSMDFELKTSGSYRDRSFVCQYQESHLDFLSRWMEKEGMYYWFEHGDHDKLIIADNRNMHDARTMAVNYRPADELDTGADSDSVQIFTCRQKPLPRQVILQDYNYRKAATELRATALVSERGIGDVMIYGEDFRNIEEGERYARLRAEEIVCGGKVFSGESTVVGLRSGYFMQLTQHYRDTFNGKYLVTEIEHRGSQAGALLNGIRSPFSNGSESPDTSYGNNFRAIAADVQFRPERVTPKPRVAGTMNATIDSEGSGEYAELDEYGQYKVQLPFDQTDKAANKGSARIRLATPYAGSDHGMHFPLHKDAEVLLSFTDGDPDQPVIVGAVPNSENRNVVDADNSHGNRISTAGGNQIYLGDTRGKQVMWLHSPFHNSTIGIGSTDSKGGGSIWSSTAGSSESLTFGSANTAVIGIRNSISASFDTSATAGVVHKAAIGTSINWTLGSDVTWKGGRSISLDDSESIALKTDAKTQANNEVLISGGQRTALAAIVNPLKSKVKKIVGFNIAANVAVAAAAAGAIGKFADAGQSPKNDGKMAPWNPYGYGVTAAQAGLTSVSTLFTHRVVRATALAIAEALKRDSSYVSNIKVNKDGIELRAEDVLPSNNTTMKVTYDGLSVKTSRIGTASIDMKLGEIAMISNNTYHTTQMKLSDSGLEADTKFGDITLTRSGGGAMKLERTGITLKSSNAVPSEIKLTSSKASMLWNSKDGFSADQFYTKAVSDDTKMELSSLTAVLSSNNTTLKLGMAGATINGQMIRLG